MNHLKVALVHAKEWLYTVPEVYLGIGRPFHGAQLSGPQVDFLINTLSSVRDVPGDVIECGVFRGGGLLTCCLAMTRLNIDKHVYAADTFCGMPAPSSEDLPDGVRSVFDGAFRYNSPKLIAGRLRLAGERKRVTLVQGLFEDALPQLRPEQTFSLAFIDCDFYDGASFCLDWLYPRMNRGGYLCIHDYHSRDAPGITRAFDEFVSGKPEVGESIWNIGYVVKK